MEIIRLLLEQHLLKHLKTRPCGRIFKKKKTRGYQFVKINTVYNAEKQNKYFYCSFQFPNGFTLGKRNGTQQ